MTSELLKYATLPYFLEGMLLALRIAGTTLVLSLILGLGLALGYNSKYRALRWLIGGYLWLIRGTPVLLQLIFWYNALPPMGLSLSGELTAIWALTIAFAAFVCELTRGGLIAVKQGQLDAGAALGMSPRTLFRRVRGPQALRVIIPSLCTLAIYLVKDTSLASVIAVDELTLRAQQEVSRTFDYVAAFGGAAAIYLAVTTVIVLAQRQLEKRLDYTNRPPAKDLATENEKHPSSSEAKQIFGTVVRDRSTSAEPVVTAQGIVKRFGDHLVLDAIDLEINQGEVVCLIGPSGSGKTTMLRCLNNLEPTTDGVIWVNGVEMGTRTTEDGRRSLVKSERKRAQARVKARVGMVFQQFNLFENMTVNDNLTVAPVRTYGSEPDDARTAAGRLLAAVGLSGYGKAYPHQLSGGQQQRVAICRALATEPTVMLFDEPTSALDPEKVGEVLEVMEELGELGMTMVVATHEISFARRCATRVVFMEDGRIVEQGPPEQVLGNPTQPRTREFLQTVLGEAAVFGAPDSEAGPSPQRSSKSDDDAYI